MKYLAEIDGRRFVIDLGANEHEGTVIIDGRAVPLRWLPVGTGDDRPVAEGEARHLSILIGDLSYQLYARPLADDPARPSEQDVEVMIEGRPYSVAVQDERTQSLVGLAGEGHTSGDATIRAPMPGLVSNVLVVEGASVTRGQAVVVLEAMKMENDLTTPRAGIVKGLRVAKGQTVNQGDTLAIIGDAGDGSADDDADDETGA